MPGGGCPRAATRPGGRRNVTPSAAYWHRVRSPPLTGHGEGGPETKRYAIFVATLLLLLPGSSAQGQVTPEKGYHGEHTCWPPWSRRVSEFPCTAENLIPHLEFTLLADRRFELTDRARLHLLAGPFLGYQRDSPHTVWILREGETTRRQDPDADASYRYHPFDRLRLDRPPREDRPTPPTPPPPPPPPAPPTRHPHGAPSCECSRSRSGARSRRQFPWATGRRPRSHSPGP